MFKTTNKWYATGIFLGIVGGIAAIAGIAAACDGIMLGFFLIMLSPFVLMATSHCFQKGNKEWKEKNEKSMTDLSDPEAINRYKNWQKSLRRI